ncbi:MAG: DEAD/DEAH box helicase, partial [Myxococcales bacterium]|nr:DEAD/DEAH box helicase [Myxococcales bacterium]
IEKQIVDIWKRHIGEMLLPVQEKAIQQYGLFESRNLIVFSPTSSGKTFIGEMAAIKAARKKLKVFYLVPQKSLAEEKFVEFSERYGEVGIRVVISNRDHREFDELIQRGDFDIAIVVYEKMQGLLVNTPSLLTSAGLIVVDELQMITDEFRGPVLEVLLTRIVTSDASPQILGLSAVLGKTDRLEKWLKARVLVEAQRPVELRKGILCQGVFNYREHNSGAAGSEDMVWDDNNSKNADLQLLLNIAHLAQRGEQCMVFMRDRNSTVFAARSLSDLVSLPSATEAIEELADMEDTYAREILTELLTQGIAFHNSDLTWAERRLIEKHFRAGTIKALFSTSTLAMGMNLPAKNVFVDSQKWKYSSKFRRWVTEDITRSEYENMSGRAGRLSLASDFGRSIMVSLGDYPAKAMARHYIEGSFEDITPTLANAPLESHVVNLIASGLCATREELYHFLLGSFTGHEVWRQKQTLDQFRKDVDQAVDICISCSTVVEHEGQLVITELGRTCASQCLHPKTAFAFFRWAQSAKDRFSTEFEMLVIAARSHDANDIYVTMSTEENRRAGYRDQVLNRARGGDIAQWAVFQAVAKETHCIYEVNKRYKLALMMDDWIEELPIKKIEQGYRVWGGAVRRVAEEFDWLIHGMALVCEIAGWNEKQVDQVHDLSLRLTQGIRNDAVELARMNLRGVGRAVLRKLVDSKLCDQSALEESSEARLSEILGPKTGKKLFDLVREGAPTAMHQEEETAPVGLVEPNFEADPMPSLILDIKQHRVSYKGAMVDLQPTPLKFIALLAKKPGKIVTKQEIYNSIWGLNDAADNPIYDHQITDTRHTLVRALERLAGNGNGIRSQEVRGLIKTKPRVGYWLDLPGDQVCVHE